MPKFRHGLILGAIVGGVTALFTAKKTGPQRQRETAAYLDDVTRAVDEVSNSASRLQTALGKLLGQLQTTVPTVQQQIQQDVTDFQFQAAPRLKQINESIATLQKDAAPLTGEQDKSHA
jgi:gas vesicle protein